MPIGMGYGYYWDPTYVLVIIGAVICMIASANVSGTFRKYNRVRNSRNMTGAQVAAQILQEAGLSNIRIEHISGDLTDHYDPSAQCHCAGSESGFEAFLAGDHSRADPGKSRAAADRYHIIWSDSVISGSDPSGRV